MNYIFCTPGSHGDVMPLASIGQRLRQRGHTVTFLCCYGYSELFDRLGLDYVPLSSREEQEAALADRDLSATRYYQLFIARHCVSWNQAALSVIERYSSAETIVVSTDRPNLWADLCARRYFGIPAIRASVDPPSALLNPTIGIAAPAVRRHLDLAIETAWRERMSARGIKSGRDHLDRIRQTSRSDVPIMALWPEWLVGASKARAAHPVFGFMPSPDFAAKPFHAAVGKLVGRRHIVIVPGTEGTNKRWVDSFLEVCGGVCRRLDCDGIVLGDDFRDEILSQDLTPAGFSPLNEVLEGASAIVHHAGIGTAAAALEKAVPQVAIPRVFAQPSNAEWLRRSGVCTVVRPECWSIENAATQLNEAIQSPIVRARARAIAGGMNRVGACDAVCDFLENRARLLTRETRRHPAEVRKSWKAV